MYLKSLTLKGFKSFADKTSMIFDPGLTVVVGPNGSGKSNVSDAILWVLGEQSAKQLRGQAMEDVIFSGSSARQPVGIAEVTLVLDNSDHTLAIDFSEVAITRRMYRSGESEYLINGAPSRLMDVQDILHDSGLGKDTHSIISQGKLDSVLSSKPEDRRSLIEEAADISKHRRRKERSERKLASMDENLARAKVIAREISRQLRPLERQVDKASKAHELQAELSELTTLLAVDDLRKLQAQATGLEAKTKEASATLEVAQYRLDEKAKELDKLQVLLEEKGLFVGDLGEQRRRMGDLLAHIDSDLRLLEEKGKNMVSRLSDMRMSMSNLEKRRHDAEVEHNKISGELLDANVLLEDRENKEEELARLQADARSKRELAEAELQELSRKQRQAQSVSDTETLAYARLEEQLSGAELEDKMFVSRLSQIEETLASTQAALEERKEHITTLNQALKQANEAATLASKQIETAATNEQRTLEARSQSQQKLGSAQATLEALSAVAAEIDSQSPLVAALNVHEKASKLVECRLSDCIEVDPNVNDIVEVLLGDDLSALVVANLDAATNLVGVAESLELDEGKATVIAKHQKKVVLTQDAPGEPLLKYVHVSRGADELVASLLGDVRLVGSSTEALKAHEIAPEFTYVTTSGISVMADGRVHVGKLDSNESGILERKKRIHALEQNMASLELALKDSDSLYNKAQSELVAARQAHVDAEAEAARITAEKQAVAAELIRLEEQHRQAVSEQEQVSKSRDEALAKAHEAKESIEGHKQAAREAQKEAEELEIQVREASSRANDAREQETSAAQTYQEARLDLAMMRERKAHLASREQELAQSISDVCNRIEVTARSSASLELIIQRVEPLHARYDALHESALSWATRLADRASLAEADSDSLKATISDAKQAVTTATTELEQARAQETELRVERGRLEVQVENAVAAIVATGAILEEALLLPEPEDREQAEHAKAQLERKLADIGPVNEVAMEEYTKLKERADFIDEQVADLESARNALKKITAAIERKMRTRFLVVFDRVNQNFADIFSMLFPGGQAHLELTDPDNLTETGLEIVAQPRGKKLAKMMLMSGGEKSLTALALLFAVYRARTVPFYVFDEVEAALDDSNLGKLLDAIDQLKETTQLIVISHQRRTMEQADVLYGVSMQADGVSRVVSQRLDKTSGKVVDI